MLSDEEVADAIALNHEVRVVEFKSAGDPSHKPFLARVARACLAMANQRGGGHVLIGVDDADPLSGPSGLNENQLAAWLNFDAVSSSINAYADPALSLTVDRRRHPAGTSIIVIEVGEFEHAPILCKRDSTDNILQQGMIYTRSRAKPESSPRHSHAELREIIDLATEKGLRSFLETARGAGFELGRADEQRFRERLAPLWSESQLNNTTSRAHFTLTFWPNKFEPSRISFNELESLVQRYRFRTSNGAYPQISSDIIRSQHAITWIQPFLARTGWRFDQSGAFALIDRVGDSSRDPDSMGDANDPRITGYISVRSIVEDVTRATMLAASLMNAVNTNDATCVLSLNNIRGRTLTVNEHHRSGFFENYTYGDDRMEERMTLSAVQRAAGARDLAIESVMNMLHKFGWSSLSPETVRILQRDYLGLTS